ncbi:MAG: D-alanyl-D-alanine carboxypeptidase family protein [Clostridia bacterium]
MIWPSGAAKVEFDKQAFFYEENSEKIAVIQQDQNETEGRHDADSDTSLHTGVQNQMQTPVDAILELVNSIISSEEDITRNTPQLVKMNGQIDFTTGTLILVNKWTSLPQNFTPEGLTKITGKSKEVKLECSYSGLTAKQEVIHGLTDMLKALKENVHNRVIITSGYRSYDYQKLLYNQKVNSLTGKLGRQAAQQQASEIVAPPGTSEHQTGLAVDITTPELLKTSDPLVSEFGETVQGQWIYENSWKYGFIIRYQPDKKDITGIIYEPWHLRYVGVPHAEIMFKNGWCLEEYHQQLRSKAHIAYSTENKKYDIFYTTIPLGQQAFNEIYGEQVQYEISGDGREGYFITIASDVLK